MGVLDRKGLGQLGSFWESTMKAGREAARIAHEETHRSAKEVGERSPLSREDTARAAHEAVFGGREVVRAGTTAADVNGAAAGIAERMLSESAQRWLSDWCVPLNRGVGAGKTSIHRDGGGR